MILLLSLLACWSSEPKLPGGGEAPDIILVSIDTLRADHLGAYGYERDTSPFLDKLAASGVRAAHFRSPSPWTLPAHTTLLTGLLPHTHRVVDDDVQMDLTLPVLPELFRERGYATGGFVATLYVSRKFGFERGFDVFDDAGITTEKKNLRGEVDAEDVVDKALKFLEDQEGKSAFVFMHFYDVHYPYEPPGEHDERFDRPSNDDDLRYRKYKYFKKNPPSAEQMTHQIAQYDEEIHYLDGELARLKEAMDRSGREAIWLVTADHGEEFLERGSWGHAHTLYAEQLRIPFILAGPGVPSGVVLDGVAGLHDIAPTLTDLTGEPLAGDGISLAPHLSGELPLPDRAFLAGTSRFDTNRLSVWEDGLRMEWDLKARRAELFADAPESKNVAPQQRQDVVRLKSRVTDLLGAPWEAAPGTVATDGTILAEGRILRTPLTVKAEQGAHFAVVPADAEVRHDDAGPYRAAGGPLPPEDGALRFTGVARGADMTLSDEDRELLEQLGYMQGEEPDEE